MAEFAVEASILAAESGWDEVALQAFLFGGFLMMIRMSQLPEMRPLV